MSKTGPDNLDHHTTLDLLKIFDVTALHIDVGSAELLQ